MIAMTTMQPMTRMMRRMTGMDVSQGMFTSTSWRGSQYQLILLLLLLLLPFLLLLLLLLLLLFLHLLFLLLPVLTLPFLQ